VNANNLRSTILICPKALIFTNSKYKHTELTVTYLLLEIYQILSFKNVPNREDQINASRIR